MSRALRIVSVCRMLPTPTNPSSGVFVLNRLEGMASRAEVQVVQPIPFFPGVVRRPSWAAAPSRVERSLRVEHVPMFYIPGILKAADGMWLARAVDRVIERLHRESPIDAIDAHFGYPEGVGCLRVARRLGIPLFITVRGVENEWMDVPGVGAKMLDAFRNAAGCIAVSHFLQELLLRHGVPAERVRVIHNAIDSTTFSFGEKQTARYELGLDSHRPLIVSVGHLVSRKRHHVLIEAFASLAPEWADAQLVIIGGRVFERSYPDQLVQLARERGVADRVRFLGNIAPGEVATWLRAADVFALGTAREGCCNAVLEALAVGVPVVTTPAGDNAYFVENDVNGYIVPIDAVIDLAQALERALSRPWDRAQIARALMSRVGTWQDVGARVVDFMEEHIEGWRANSQGVAARAIEGERST
jgi:teichuronic acid biosynthesis glycosyltransferase TuaC